MRPLAATLLLAAAFVAPAHAADLADTLTSDGRFGKFADLVQRSGLMPMLHGTAPATVFAPTDEAFERVPAEMLAPLASEASSRSPGQETEKLQALVRIHVLAGVSPPERFVGQRGTVTDQAGTQLIVDGTQSGRILVTTVPVNVGGPAVAGVTTAREAQVVGEPIAADNGLIYPIDNLLIQ